MNTFLSKNNHLKSFLIIALASFSTGCDKQINTVTTDTSFSRPAMIEEIAASDVSGLSFTGLVRAAQRVELSFKVAGKIAKINAQEGVAVNQGQLLAELDDYEQKIALSSAKTQFSKAEADYQRGLSIYNSTQAISKSDLEKLKTERDLAKNKFNSAIEALEHTKIKAPFSGVITKKLMNEFSVVQPNQMIFILQNLNDLEVVIDVPSKLFAEGSRNKNAVGHIEGLNDIDFPLYYKYFTLESEQLTQTYNVILGFSDLKNQNVLPGMSINVTPEANSTDAMQISLPLSAISPDNMGKKYVWLVDMDSKVTKKMVETGTLLGDRIIITSGLQPQDKVVIAGVNSLKEGDMVRPLDSEGAK